jgi:hypothetical protein
VGNGIDEDCDGADGFNDGFGTDADGDGDYAFPAGTDCDDTDPDVNSFGFEVPENGVDEDCDGSDQVIPGAAVRFKARWVAVKGKAGGARLAALKALRVRSDTVLRLKVTCPRKGCPSRVKRTDRREDGQEARPPPLPPPARRPARRRGARGPGQPVRAATPRARVEGARGKAPRAPSSACAGARASSAAASAPLR